MKANKILLTNSILAVVFCFSVTVRADETRDANTTNGIDGYSERYSEYFKLYAKETSRFDNWYDRQRKAVGHQQSKRKELQKIIQELKSSYDPLDRAWNAQNRYWFERYQRDHNQAVADLATFRGDVEGLPELGSGRLGC